MMLPIFLSALGLLALVIILRLAIAQNLSLRNGPDSAGTIRPINIEAFRNLIDPAENQYLRRRLTPTDFRAVRRARLRAMAAYVHTAAKNAAVLVRMAHRASASSDPVTAQAARQLLHDAMLLRRNATVALAQIYLALAWPYSDFAAAGVVDGYEHLSGSAMLLGRLQNPTVPVRLWLS